MEATIKKEFIQPDVQIIIFVAMFFFPFFIKTHQILRGSLKELSDPHPKMPSYSPVGGTMGQSNQYILAAVVNQHKHSHTPKGGQDC